MSISPQKLSLFTMKRNTVAAVNEDYITRMREQMVQSIRKEQLSGHTNQINRGYTDSYKPCGMYNDSSL